MEVLTNITKAMFISDWLLISYLLFISSIIVLDIYVNFTSRVTRYINSEDILLLAVIAIWIIFLALEPLHNALSFWGSIRNYESYTLNEAYHLVVRAVSIFWVIGAAISSIINPLISKGNKLIKAKWFFYGWIMNIPSIFWLLKQQQLKMPNNKINADQKPVA